MALLNSSSSSSLSNDSLSPSPKRVPATRPSRSKKLPAKLREVQDDEEVRTFEELELEQSRNVVVKCAQQGKRLIVKMKDLSTGTLDPLRKTDLKKGAFLLTEYKGKSYPVLFELFADDVKRKAKDNGVPEGTEKSRKRVTTADDLSAKRTTLMKVKQGKENQQPPHKKLKTVADKEDEKQITTVEEYQCDDALKELVIRLDKRVETIERQQASVSKKLDQLIDLSSSAGGGLNTAVKKEVEEDFVVNGVNLLRLHSTHPYGYALTLLDTLFTREEQNQCLMFKSKKSGKPSLDPVKVEKMLACINRKYSNTEWDMKVLIQKVNQKCRDALKKTA